MRTILLLAGRSRRLWPLADKYLFPICGKTVLEHHVDRLRKGGCTDFIFVAGKHNMGTIKELFPKETVVEQKDLELGMRGALLDALPLCKNDSVLIVGSDLIEASAYADIVKRARKSDAFGFLLARTVDRYFPGGYLTMRGERIVGIVEKPGEGKEPSTLVNLVTHFHRDASVLLKALKTTTSAKDDAYELALTKLFKNHVYEAVAYRGSWHPVKYPWHLLELTQMLLGALKKKTIHQSAKIHKSAVIDGNVVIEAGARILPNAVIVGPAYIGKRTIVGNNSLVRQSSVGDDCVVGYNTEVKAASLHHHVWTHSTYIGDSVIGRNVAFGAGCVTGNLRLDEGVITSTVNGEKISTGLTKFGAVIGNDARIGIHVSINPGIKIGARAFVSSATLVSRDVPDQSFAKLVEGDIHIRENRTPAREPQEREQYRKKI